MSFVVKNIPAFGNYLLNQCRLSRRMIFRWSSLIEFLDAVKVSLLTWFRNWVTVLAVGIVLSLTYFTISGTCSFNSFWRSLIMMIIVEISIIFLHWWNYLTIVLVKKHFWARTCNVKWNHWSRSFSFFTYSQMYLGVPMNLSGTVRKLWWNECTHRHFFSEDW